MGGKGILVHAISPGALKTRAASGLKDFDLLLIEVGQRAPIGQHHGVTASASRGMGRAPNIMEKFEGSSMESFRIANIVLDRFGPRPGRMRRKVCAPGTASGGGAGVAAALVMAALAFAPSAHASFLPPEMMDSAAMYLAWFIIIFVPIGAIALFWLVHVLPEKIAHKRHHPQRDAIHVLCLLSLAFGGLLWPIAWLWAYTKPVSYRLAYGTEKHEDYYHELGEKARAGELLEHELSHLREELDAMAAKGSLTAELKVLRKDLAAVTPAPAVPVAAQAAPGGNAAKGAVA